jgi:hypothetical protein
MKTEQNYFTSSWLIIRIFVTLSAIYPNCFLGQEYYYSNGQQVDLTTDYREIIVFFNQDVDLDSIIMSHENLLTIEKNVPYNAVIAHFSAALSSNFSVTQLGLDQSMVKCHAFGKITEDGTPIFLTNKVVIEGRMNTNYGEILQSNINLFDGQFERIEHKYCVFAFASTQIALNFANAMYESHTVNYSIPDIFARIRSWDDPLYSTQLQVSDQPTIIGTDGPMDIDVDADEVWPLQTGNSDVIVAVFDDGLEAHEDFNTDNLMSGFNTNALFYEYPEIHQTGILTALVLLVVIMAYRLRVSLQLSTMI